MTTFKSKYAIGDFIKLSKEYCEFSEYPIVMVMSVSFGYQENIVYNSKFIEEKVLNKVEVIDE